MSGFEVTSMILTFCQTYSVHRLFCLATTAAQPRPVPNVAFSSALGAIIECVLGCLGQLIPFPRRRLVTNHAAHKEAVMKMKMKIRSASGLGAAIARRRAQHLLPPHHRTHEPGL